MPAKENFSRKLRSQTGNFIPTYIPGHSRHSEDIRKRPAVYKKCRGQLNLKRQSLQIGHGCAGDCSGLSSPPVTYDSVIIVPLDRQDAVGAQQLNTCVSLLILDRIADVAQVDHAAATACLKKAQSGRDHIRVSMAVGHDAKCFRISHSLLNIFRSRPGAAADPQGYQIHA